VTVAVLAGPGDRGAELAIPPGDLHWQACRSGGPGGQHVNKTASAIILTHLPTGTQIRADGSRDQSRNRQDALQRLRDTLASRQRQAVQDQRNQERSGQIGSGERSDKIRTIRMQDGQVNDHRTGRRIPLQRFLAGELEGLG